MKSRAPVGVRQLHEIPDMKDPSFDDDDMNFAFPTMPKEAAPQVPQYNAMEMRPTHLLFTGNIDLDYPQMKQEDILPWYLFTQRYESKDLKMTDELEMLCK